MADDPFLAPIQSLALTLEGEAFLIWLISDVCGVFRSPMAPTERDSAYLFGKQDVGNALLPLVARASPKTLNKLLENL
jgi:hypothetical protein